MRKGMVARKTSETDIKLSLCLEGDGNLQGDSGSGFLNHMLQQLVKHGGFNLQMEVQGDYEVDNHHTVEDIGLCLGKAFFEALGDKKGIARYASLALPLDEALVLCVVDVSGRPGLFYDVDFTTEKIGEFETELVQVFWQAFAIEARVTLHIRKLAGENSHHLAEAVFKGMARVLKSAVKIESKDIPSSKGVL